MAGDIQGLIGNVILSSHVASSPYSINEFMTDLYNGTWSNLLQGKALTEGRQDFAKHDGGYGLCIIE